MKFSRTWRGARRVAVAAAVLAGAAALSGTGAPSASASGTAHFATLWTAGNNGQTVAQATGASGQVVNTQTTGVPPYNAVIVGSDADYDFRTTASYGTNAIMYNPTDGTVQPIGLFDGRITFGQFSFAWVCKDECETLWKPIGYDDVNSDGYPDVVWYDATENKVAAWLTDGTRTTIGGRQYLTVTDSLYLTTGCSSVACGTTQAVGSGDVNNDGNVDILTYDATGGGLTVWTTNGHGGFTGAQPLSWQCASVCAGDWQFIGLSDANQDGRLDVVWYDVWTGQVAAWKLNGSGVVTGTITLATNTPAWAHIVGVSTAMTPVP